MISQMSENPKGFKISVLNSSVKNDTTAPPIVGNQVQPVANRLQPSEIANIPRERPKTQ